MTAANPPRRLTLWGASLMALIALIHLFVVPEYFEYATYLGLLFVVNFVGSIASAIGIYRGVW